MEDVATEQLMSSYEAPMQVAVLVKAAESNHDIPNAHPSHLATRANNISEVQSKTSDHAGSLVSIPAGEDPARLAPLLKSKDTLLTHTEGPHMVTPRVNSESIVPNDLDTGNATCRGDMRQTLSSRSPGASSPTTQAKAGDDKRPEESGTAVKCAGCGKTFMQPFAVPQKANKIVLSLCDNCEDITSAMFLCISCGQECNSLSALRAHKQAHVPAEQRIYVCEMCGVGFHKQFDLDIHICACISQVVSKGKSNHKKSLEADSKPPDPPKNSRRKSREQKVRVEAIVKTLTKRTQATTISTRSSKRTTATCKSTSSKQSRPPKKSTSSSRARSTRKAGPVSDSKVSPSTKSKRRVQIKYVKIPVSSRVVPRKKVLKPPKVFECTDCSELFTDGKEFRKHKLTHKKKEIFTCETCKKAFKSKANLKRHEVSHSSEPTNVCNICDKKFQSSQTLFTHRKTVHNDEKPFVCDICKKAFKQLGNMKTHRRTHTGEKPFLCKECGRPFAQMGNLQAHMVIHATSKPHVCEICGKSFSYLRSLQNHRRGTHTGERPFSCGVCGKTFSNPSVLRDHKRTHSDKRGYLCDKCGKGFKSYKNLKQHEKFHLDVRPYSCQECGKGFVWFKSFQLHKRTHTGEKPYGCDLCEKVFANINSLKYHKQKHEGSTLPAARGRSGTKAAPPPPPPVPPSADPVLPQHPPQSMLPPHPNMQQGPPRDHMHSAIHPHPQVTVSSPSSTPHPLPSLPPHSQAYSHVVFPQFPSFVTNSGADFTIL